MVYRTESLNKESCEDFAAAFAQGAGVTFSDAYYYDDMTYFANHSSGDTLSVDYRDSSYTYRLGTPLAVSEGSEAELRGAARPAWNRGARGRGIFPGGSGHFPIYGGLSPRGRCNLWRGAPLPCGGRIAGAGGKPPAGADAPARGVPSPQAEAYDRMTRGEFDGAVTFASLQPLEATVTACAITYQSDTKGFYQPVYQFTVMKGDEPFAEVLIPALQ